MTTPWAHLPNAQHIDWVLADLKTQPEKWGAAWTAARNAAWDAAWDTTRGAARGAAWTAARGAAWDAARDAAWTAAWDAAWTATWDAARDALLALIAYDDCAHLLEHDTDHLRRLHKLDHFYPPYVLLQPAVIVRNMK